MNINLALQISAFLNRDALRRDISGDHRRLAQLNAVTGLDVALQFALHHHPLGLDAAFHLAVGANRQAVAFESNAALDLAIQIQIFAPVKLALDDNRLADLCQSTLCQPTGRCAHWTISS